VYTAATTVCASATCVASSATSVAGSTASVAYPTPSIANPAVAAATVTVATTTVAVTATAPIAAIPRAGADKEPAYKPTRSVVAIGSAGIGSVRIVPPRANRCHGRISIAVVAVPAVPGTNPDTDTYLGLGWSREKRCGNHDGA
jgi:hypothetical protein